MKKNNNQCRNEWELQEETYSSIGHVMMPLQLATAVLFTIKFLDFRNVIFQFQRQRDHDPVRTTSPRPGIQDFNIDGI